MSSSTRQRSAQHDDDHRHAQPDVRDPAPAVDTSERSDAPSTWYAASGAPLTDELLEWPPDLFAFANVVLARAEAFRFALGPVDEWPPSRHRAWVGTVEEAARRWSLWVEDPTGAIPDLVTEEWQVAREGAETPLERLALGEEARLREALLTLHAVADEACAGVGIALDTSDAEAPVYRARGRELLARKGSLARVDARFFRVLPKVSTPPTGRPAFSRYACVQGPGIEARWHKIPARHPGTDLRSEYAHAAAPAVAADGARVRLSPGRRLRAEGEEGSVRVLRVRAVRRR
jgi:hypothetical protein